MPRDVDLLGWTWTFFLSLHPTDFATSPTPRAQLAARLPPALIRQFYYCAIFGLHYHLTSTSLFWLCRSYAACLSLSRRLFRNSMAPNGHAAAGRNEARQSRSSSLRNWLDQYGDTEFRTWQDEHPTHDLTYDDWKHSEHVDGLSLYYATLSLFEEPDSSVSLQLRIA